MIHILSIEREGGGFPAVGTAGRMLNKSGQRSAVNLAEKLARKNGRRVLVESWHEHDFYKHNAKPRLLVIHP